MKELRGRNPENLHAALAVANGAKRLTRKLPPLPTVRSWIEASKSLRPVIEH